MLGRTQQLMAIRREDGVIISDNVICAFSFFQRLQGLIGLSHLPEQSALWLKPGGSIHTCGMRFPIDAVFLDSNLRILAISQNIHPWRWRLAPRHTHSTLELASDRNSRLRLRRGDELFIRHNQGG